MVTDKLRSDQVVRLKELRVVIRNKNESWVWRLLGVFFWTWHRGAWTTWRWPWSGPITIWTAAGVGSLQAYHRDIVDHELFHCVDLRPTSGPWKLGALQFLFPLPVLFSGRWYVEREAYLDSIRRGKMTIDEAIKHLWGFTYLYPWPPFLMRRWFTRELEARGSL